ncbi:hypothetical protein [Curtobacterium sp. MCPF17_031]|uniref:hypothetical protein n=1 Tax=Curtobacterium sp. MCPF17_031 TaxID=2175653 RepID=UPI000DA9B4B2|nr:hypothetical protein [Curtobacterium sp. MCPF17_031]PZE33931.1 hypothetical protein DEJ31_15945 [Curtobacterium sp. MCPF17_031]
MTNPTRNKDAGIPGNGGQFAGSQHTEAATEPLREYVPSKNVDVLVAASQAARARVAAGKPSWGERIPAKAIWQDETTTWDQKRDKFVTAVKASKWYAGQEEFSEQSATPSARRCSPDRQYATTTRRPRTRSSTGPAGGMRSVPDPTSAA